MHQVFKQVVVTSLALAMAGTLAACGPRSDIQNTTKTQSEAYRLHPYGTNGTLIDDKWGVRPYGTGPYGVRPDTAHMYPNAAPGTYTPYGYGGVRPYTAAQRDQQAAQRMSQLAANVNGVTRATAIVYGNNAIIGIEGATASNMKMLERSVHEALRRAEPGYSIHVTADKTLTQRVRTLSDRMNGTSPLRAVGQDIAALIRDIGRSVTAPFR
jgi:hypothetical protein